MRAHVALVVALSGAALAACAEDGARLDRDEAYAQPIDRFLLGEAAEYPADPSLLDQTAALERSMTERRSAAWAVAARVLDGVGIAADEEAALRVPRFQTWYGADDVLPMFDRLFRGLSPEEQRARSAFDEDSLRAVFPWNATRAPTLASFTQERLQARRRDLQTSLGAHSLGKDARTLMSPAYVSHVFRSYGEILRCKPPAASDESSFAPCLAGEFPGNAAAVKARWVRGETPMPVYDTSPAVLAEKLAAGTFGSGDREASPGEDDIYTMRLTPDTTMRLAGLHIVTKELRDWVWITLWWSDEPDSDFGADRPDSIRALGGPWSHYKMCVAVAYDEKDSAHGRNGPRSWCSNPYLETGERAATTNCIGCHQHGGTGETTETVLANEAAFPDHGRAKVRRNFPADYSFVTHGGLDLAAEMRARVEAVSPP